jgi:fatty-acid desaturase
MRITKTKWLCVFQPIALIGRQARFLFGTFVLTLTAVPWYLWYFGFDWFHFAVAAVLLAATGFSITLGYHRLFSHMTFRAKLPVRLFTLTCSGGCISHDEVERNQFVKGT